MDPISLPPGFQIVKVSGPLLLSYLFRWGLFGVLSVQLYIYYQAFPNDKLAIKCLVYTVYAIGLVETILITHDAFETFGYGFGDFLALTKINLAWLDVPVASGLAALIGQSFYAYRLYVLSSKSWFLPVLIMIVSLASSLGAFLTAGWCLEVGDFSLVDSTKVSVAAGVWCGAAAASDIIIAVCMTYYLSKQVSGFRQTREMVSKLIRLTIETGVVTAVVAITNVILFYAFPDGRAYYVASTGVMPRLYSICILVVLNARCEIIGSRVTEVSSTGFTSAPAFKLGNLGPAAARAKDALTSNQGVWSGAVSHDPEMQTMDASDGASV
ncbi:hypothetical protein FB451DRAFT_1567106 [Mycena latifolia]|nr:hypothetical protein FB451DRAFT_1567106 [Mycena latifolia]